MKGGYQNQRRIEEIKKKKYQKKQQLTKRILEDGYEEQEDTNSHDMEQECIKGKKLSQQQKLFACGS